MTKLGGIVIAVAALVALTGCSAPANDPEASSPTVSASASPSTAPEAAPLVMSAESATASADPMGGMTPDDFYLASIEGALRSVDASDEQLIAAGKLACEQLSDGKTYFEVSVVKGSGEDAVWNNRNIAMSAMSAYCPQS